MRAGCRYEPSYGRHDLPTNRQTLSLEIVMTDFNENERTQGYIPLNLRKVAVFDFRDFLSAEIGQHGSSASCRGFALPQLCSDKPSFPHASRESESNLK